MIGLLRGAVAGLRGRRGRAALAGLGIGMAAAMLAGATVVAYGLHTGFSRTARAADLPDVIARFDGQRLGTVDRRIRALPNLAAVSFRLEVTKVHLTAGHHHAADGVVEVTGRGRRGYQLLAGRDVGAAPNQVVVEQGVARAWGVRVGSTLTIRGLGSERVVGLSRSPDNVAFPLAAPRVYVSRAGLDRRFGADRDPRVNLVQLWVRNRSRLDETLVQARATSYGLRGLRFVTRSGVGVMVDQAAGIVIALLVALSTMALLTAGIMLAATARAEVQRRLRAIGVQRALGATRGHVTLTLAAEAGLVAAPAGAIGVLVGLVAVGGPSQRLLDILNEAPPGGRLLLPLLACWAVTVAIPVAASAWPAWRVARKEPVVLLRGAELRGREGRSRAGPGGLGALGARLVGARRARLVATLAVLGASVGFILLMVALASQLRALQTDPGALGKRYQLTASLPAAAAPRVAALSGVAGAAPRYEVQGLDSFSLGEPIDVVAYPGDHTVYEAPPLTAGHRLRGPGTAEVGTGLAQVLGLRVGSELAIQLPSGTELRVRVAGLVSALQDDGRVAYVPASTLLAAQPHAPEKLAVRLRAGADPATVSRELQALGAAPAASSGAVAKGRALVDALTAILRVIAIVDGLVCLYTLVQALALTARERRGTIAVLRACGAGPGAVRRLLAGAAAAVLLPAALIGILLETLLLGPATARLAAGYAPLSLSARPSEVALVLAGLVLIAGTATLWVARQATRERIVAGLAAA